MMWSIHVLSQERLIREITILQSLHRSPSGQDQRDLGFIYIFKYGTSVGAYCNIQMFSSPSINSVLALRCLACDVFILLPFRCVCGLTMMHVSWCLCLVALTMWALCIGFQFWQSFRRSRHECCGLFSLVPISTWIFADCLGHSLILA